MFCRSCGQTIPDNSVNCPNCGYPTATQQQPQQYQPQYQQQPAPSEPTAPPAKKRHGCLIAILVVLALLIGTAIAVYFLMPGLFRPVDLGVKTTQKAYESALDKLNYTKDEAPTTGKQEDYNYVYGPLIPVSTGLDSEEVTSFFNLNRPAYFPLKNVQVRIGTGAALCNSGRTYVGPVLLSALPLTTSGNAPIEVSATVNRDYVIDYLLRGEYSQAEIEDAMKSINIDKLIPAEVNLYVKMSGSIENNKIVGLTLYSASVLGVEIPAEQVTSQDANSLVSGVIDMLLADYNERSGAYFISIKTADGEIIIDGQIPSSLTRTPNE